MVTTESIPTDKYEVGKYEVGLLALQSGDFESAATHWLSAAETAAQDDAEKIADGLSSIAILMLKSEVGSISEAETLFKRVIELRQKFLPEDDKSLAIEFTNLALLYDHQDNIETATEYAEKAVAILEQHSALDKIEYAQAYDMLAQFLFESNHLTRARLLCQKAVQINDLGLGPNNPLSLLSIGMLSTIEEAIKPHSRTARELRKETTSRMDSLLKVCQQRGDSFLADALIEAELAGETLGTDVIIETLTALAEDDDFMSHLKAVHSAQLLQ